MHVHVHASADVYRFQGPLLVSRTFMSKFKMSYTTEHNNKIIYDIDI